MLNGINPVNPTLMMEHVTIKKAVETRNTRDTAVRYKKKYKNEMIVMNIKVMNKIDKEVSIAKLKFNKRAIKSERILMPKMDFINLLNPLLAFEMPKNLKHNNVIEIETNGIEIFTAMAFKDGKLGQICLNNRPSI